MSIKRIIQCSVCRKKEMEADFGKGWQGWAIIQGIAEEEPKAGEALTQDNMQVCLCPEHTVVVSNFISKLQKEE